jgi:hypothetical protein
MDARVHEEVYGRTRGEIFLGEIFLEKLSFRGAKELKFSIFNAQFSILRDGSD